MRNIWPVLFVLLIEVSYCIIRTNNAKEPILIPLINDPSVLRFKSSTTDFYRLLDLDAYHLLIGARDVVYNISISNFAEVQSIKWPSKAEDITECQRKGRNEKDCHNFVRVLAKDNDTGVLVCGTNSFEPMCRQYERDRYGEYRLDFEFPGIGLSPYDPNHNSTFLRDGDMLYAGTVSDFSASDPLIHRRNVTKTSDLGIRTGRNDAKVLNEPQFAGSFKDEQHVYLWFREQALESESTERAIYSRVARLCSSDMGGGPRSFTNEWTSFVKARLNCSIPGNYPFYFDQVEAIAKLVSGQYEPRKENAQLVYAVFGSPLAGISSSAICAYDLSHITKVFSTSPYHNDGNNNPSAWSRDESVSKHRPGTCVPDSRKLPVETIAYARANLLMEHSVQNYFGAPLSIYSGSDRFTQISVDAQVEGLDGRKYDILYVGTDKGNVFKLVNLAGAGAMKTSPSHHVYTMQVTSEPIRNMLLFKSDRLVFIDYTECNESYLIVVSDESVLRVPTSQCSKFDNCYECVALRDPHCAWDTDTSRCIRVNVKKPGLRQELVEGRTDHTCGPTRQHKLTNEATADVQEDPSHPGVVPLSSGSVNNCSCDKKSPADLCPTDSAIPVPSVVSSEVTASIFGGRATIVLLTSGIGILGVLFGFFAGCLYTYWKAPQKENSSLLQGSFMQSPLQPVYNANCQRRSPNQSPTNVINAYASTPKFNGTVPSSISPVSLDVEDIEKPQPKMAWGTSTLPKDYRVKQMYL